MTLGEQILLVVLLAAFVFFLLLPRMQRASRWRMPPTSDGLSMPASKALAEAEITARNAHVYHIEDIPPETDQLTLYRYYWEFRSEGVGGAYLYSGIRSLDECRGRNSPAPYYPHKAAIWSWDGSHYLSSNDGLQVEVKSRFDHMLALLVKHDWRGAPYDEQTVLLHLYRVSEPPV